MAGAQLAASLHNVAATLRLVGRRRGSIDAITESVALRRQIVQQAATAHLADLARSLVLQAQITAGADPSEDVFNVLAESLYIAMTIQDAQIAEWAPAVLSEQDVNSDAALAMWAARHKLLYRLRAREGGEHSASDGR